VEGNRILDLLHKSTTTSTRQADKAKTTGQLAES
jgi:hypothetical protein